MPIPIINYFPAAITAGDSVRVQLGFGDYPAGTWTAALKLNQPGGKVVSVTGSAVSTEFLFEITAAITEKMGVGEWTWAVRVASSSDRATAQGGTFTLQPDYAAVTDKTITQRQLDAANDQLLILTGNPDATVSFNGQTFTKANESSLLDVIARLEQKVSKEAATAAGLRGDAPTRSIRPYFV